MKPLKIKIALFIFLLTSLFPQSLSAANLEQELQSIIQNEPALKGAIVGISIRSGKTGEMLYQFNGDTRLRPASNMKLFTAAAALSALGEEHIFKTEVYTDGVMHGNTLKGNVYLVGKGDPTLKSEDFQALASQLMEKGIRKIEGNLIGDDSWYDAVRLSQDMIWTDEEHYYGAQISALTAAPNGDYDTGSVIVEIKPGKHIGDKARIELIPQNDYIKVLNRISTVSPEGKAYFHMEREHGSNHLILEGMLPIATPRKKEYIAVWEPTGYALDLFKQGLKAQGIILDGKVQRGQFKAGKIIAIHFSIPLSQLLVPFMKLSNNVHAEVLIKEMGKQRFGKGSWQEGIKVLNEELKKFGINTKTLMIRDGSGISHIDLVTTNELSKLLYVIQNKPWFSTYYESLPVAGKTSKMIGGTLRKRMADLQVQAKTGTLTTVTSISGYTKTRSGESLIFSVIMNNLLDEHKGKQVEDKLIKVIANQ
nr:D-alanyl-D-alanine carboxypeptidase/D-alanyl-D-alanine-endopeptidase [Robertmurraya massiliosenegalensis]